MRSENTNTLNFTIQLLSSRQAPMKTLPSLLLLLLFLCVGSAADGDWHLVEERTALNSFKRVFDNPLLNAHWLGIPCFFNSSAWLGIQCLNNRVTSIALDSIGLSGHLSDPLVLASLTGLINLSLKNNSISGGMMDFSTNSRLTAINLAMNNFIGPISKSLTDLSFLESLQLYHNNFSGSIPPLNQTRLKAINLSYNSLSGEIPQTIPLRDYASSSSFIGNPELCGKPTITACTVTMIGDNVPKNEKGKKKGLFSKSPFISIFVLLDALVLFLLVWSVFVFCKKQKSKDVADKEEGVKEKSAEISVRVEVEPRRITFIGSEDLFSLDELLRASAEGLGKGSFGSCYKAKLSEGRAIVVKRLRDLSPLTGEEFDKHMRVLEGLRHANLLPLIGYYFGTDDKLFFYKFLSQGNLRDRIHAGRGEGRIPFTWNDRLAVAKGVARAMEYLHLSSTGLVPHGNLKSSNILLSDDDEVSLVCDYGLIPLVPAPLAAQRLVAYQSPEYQDNRTVSRKSDVWSYGCLLLELVTGRVSANHNSGQGGADLSYWVHRAVREEWTCEVFDLEISRQASGMQDMFKLLQVALRCCERFPERRPEMAEVAREVEKIEPSEPMDDEEEYSHEWTTPLHLRGKSIIV